MATKKLSQIDPAPTPPSAADQFVGVRNGGTDILFSEAQMAEAFAGGGGGAEKPVLAVAVTPPVTFNASYGAGIVIGGVLHFANLFDPATTSGKLTFVRVALKTRQDQLFTLYLFTANPAASTFVDNVLAAINATDANKVLAAIPLTPQNQLGNHTIYATALTMAVDLPGSDLWGVLVPDGQFTTPLSSTSDVTAELHVIAD